MADEYGFGETILNKTDYCGHISSGVGRTLYQDPLDPDILWNYVNKGRQIWFAQIN